jgi:hypothetical protein
MKKKLILSLLLLMAVSFVQLPFAQTNKGRQGKMPLFAINGQTFGIKEEVKVGSQVKEKGHIRGLEVNNRKASTHTYQRNKV